MKTGDPKETLRRATMLPSQIAEGRATRRSMLGSWAAGGVATRQQRKRLSDESQQGPGTPEVSNPHRAGRGGRGELACVSWPQLGGTTVLVDLSHSKTAWLLQVPGACLSARVQRPFIGVGGKKSRGGTSRGWSGALVRDHNPAPAPRALGWPAAGCSRGGGPRLAPRDLEPGWSETRWRWKAVAEGGASLAILFHCCPPGRWVWGAPGESHFLTSTTGLVLRVVGRVGAVVPPLIGCGAARTRARGSSPAQWKQALGPHSGLTSSSLLPQPKKSASCFPRPQTPKERPEERKPSTLAGSKKGRAQPADKKVRGGGGCSPASQGLREGKDRGCGSAQPLRREPPGETAQEPSIRAGFLGLEKGLSRGKCVRSPQRH